MGKYFKQAISAIFSAVTFVFIWWVCSKLINKSLFLPSPAETFETFSVLCEGGAILKHIGASFLRVTIGVLVGATISVPFGMLIAWYKPVGKVFEKIVASLAFLPVSSLQSLLVLFFGIGETMKIGFIILAVVFSFLPTVIDMCNQPNVKLKETAYTMGFSYPRMLLHCFIPYLAPNLVQSIITLYGVGWTYVILAEKSNTQFGLGQLMYSGSARAQTPMVYVAIVVVFVVSIVFDRIANWCLKKCFKWYFVEKEEDEDE